MSSAVATGSSRIVTGPEPAVIDEELCRKCISSVKSRSAQGGEAEGKKEVITFREAKALLLSYQNILKIDNLIGFTIW